MRAFIDENELEVLRAEEFVRTNARALKRSSDVAIILSGRIDLVCRRSDGRLFLLDMNTGNWLPSDLEWAALPSTVIYTMLGHELRRQNQDIRERTMGDVEVAQILPHLAAYASARLTEYDLEEGRSLLRCLVLALDAGHYPATRGEWCAYCPLYATGDCPAWTECHTDAVEDFQEESRRHHGAGSLYAPGTHPAWYLPRCSLYAAQPTNEGAIAMHDMPQDLAESMDKDSYSSKTGVRPQDLASQTLGEGVEAAVEGDPDATMTQARPAEVTEQIARKRLADDGVGGQG